MKFGKIIIVASIIYLSFKKLYDNTDFKNKSYLSGINNDVDTFLKHFKLQKSIFGINYRDDRKKNFETLFLPGFSKQIRNRLIDSLKPDDLLKGPVKDNLNKGPDMWIFTKRFKNYQFYIKLTLGEKSNKVQCISFHI